MLSPECGLHFDELTVGSMERWRKAREKTRGQRLYNLRETLLGARFHIAIALLIVRFGDVPFFVSSSVLPRLMFVKDSSEIASILFSNAA
jgi:hypothetical protein